MNPHGPLLRWIRLSTTLGPALWLACWLLVTGCASVTSNPLTPGQAELKSQWHSVVMVPSTNLPPIHFYNKLNPVWWLGNAEEPRPPAWYRPDGSCRTFMWYLRNPFVNFSYYVIGVADKKTVRYGVFPTLVGNPNGGWNFAVTRRRMVYLPFIDYKYHRFEFYCGWRERANFGMKLNFRQKLPSPESQALEATTHLRGLFIWDQPIDF